MTFVERRVIGGLIVLLIAVTPVLAQERSRRVIRVVTDNDYAPFVFRSADGTAQGVVIDQWRAWERVTGVRADIHLMDWNQAVRAMHAGEFDVIDMMVETPDRRGEFDFTPPYAKVGASIFFRKEISGITDLASLERFPVGVKAGDQHVDRLRETGATAIISFANYNDMVRAAKRRQINVFVADTAPVLYLLHKTGIAGEFRQSVPLFQDDLRRAVRKGDAETLRLVATGFAAIPRGELKTIDEKWFGRTIDDYRDYLNYAGYAAAAAISVILILSIWNRALSRKILQRTAALHESEQRFRQIAENIREVFWLRDTDSGRFLYLSPAYEMVWGRPREDVYANAQAAFDAIHPEDRDRVVETSKLAREQGVDTEYRVVRSDGSVRWVWDRGFPIKDGDGRIYRVAGLAEDITERKMAVELVKAAEDQIRLAINTIPAMVWCLLPDGRLDFVNERWLDYTGLPPEEALVNATTVLHPDDLQRILDRWGTDMNGGQASEDEMRLRRADGEYRWFLVRTVPLRDERGEIVYWYGTSTDIEDRKRAEETAAQRESQLAEAQRIAHVGSWDWDLATKTGTFSDECYRIYGAQPGEPDFYNRSIAFVHPEDRARVLSALERPSSQEPHEVEFRITRGDEGERILRSLVRIESDASGAPLRVMGTTQDVTELRHAEKDVQATSDRLRTLSARVQSAREEEGIRIAREIHDELGAALTSLRWDLEGVRKTMPEPEKPKWADMLDATDTMIQIVRRIASDLRPVVLDVLGVEDAIEWQARQFEHRTGIEVRYESPHSPVELDPVQATAVFRIFQEALTNVLRHANATRVDVAVLEDTGTFVLIVGDNGRGIRDEERAGDQSIGLLGMRERAHLIGGEVDVSGIAGEGTTVTLRVPLSGEPPS